MAVMFKEKRFFLHTSNCDFKNNAKASGILDIFQDMASMNAEEIGVGFDDMDSMGYIWAVLYEQMEVVRRLPKYKEEVIVKTWPKSRGKLEFEREYELDDSEGNVLIRGISNWVAMDKWKRTLVKGDDIHFNGEYYPYSHYSEKQKRKLNLNADNACVEYTYLVGLDDLDSNMHMNNAKYLNMIYNMQNEKEYRCWKKVEIAFLHEAKLKDGIEIKHWKEDNKDYYKGFISNVACFEAIMEWEE